MSTSIGKTEENEETHNASLVRGGMFFFGGLVLCAAALLAQAALLEAVGGLHKKN